MGWKIEVLIVSIKYRSKDIGGAERKLLDPYLGKWVYGVEWYGIHPVPQVRIQKLSLSPAKFSFL